MDKKLFRDITTKLEEHEVHRLIAEARRKAEQAQRNKAAATLEPTETAKPDAQPGTTRAHDDKTAITTDGNSSQPAAVNSAQPTIGNSAQQSLPFDTQDDSTSIIPYEIIATITQFDNIYETRLFGWCLAKAQSVLKLYNKDLREINLQLALDVTRITLPAKLLLNPGDKNYSNITKAFSLRSKTIDYTKDGKQMFLTIIAFPEILKQEDGRLYVTFLLHREVWRALLDFSHGHRLFNLATYIRLTSKYAVIMYLLCSQQDTKPRSYGMTRLRHILGCDSLKGYDRGNNFVQKVLAPARAELIAKAPYYFDYSLTKTGRSNKITEVIIIPQINTQYTQTDDSTRKAVTSLRSRLDKDVRIYCETTFAIRPKPLEKLEPLILALGDKDAQMSKLADIKTQINIRRVKNPAGYFTRALKNTR